MSRRSATTTRRRSRARAMRYAPTPTARRRWTRAPRACRTARSSTSRWRTNRRAALSCAGSCARCRRSCRSYFSPRATASSMRCRAWASARATSSPKAVRLPHLIARVNALFRRVDALRKPSTPGELVRRGALTLDAERMQAQWDGQVVLLSLTEFWIVHALARHPGHVRNRQQLMDAANVVLDDNTITSHVKRIRRKFQSIDPKFDAVQTVYGMGYRWVE